MDRGSSRTGAAVENDTALKNIVCAVDLKTHSERVLEWAQQISGEYQAALHVVHATPAHETRPASYFDTKLRLNLEAEGKDTVPNSLRSELIHQPFH